MLCVLRVVLRLNCVGVDVCVDVGVETVDRVELVRDLARVSLLVVVDDVVGADTTLLGYALL